MQKMKKKRLMEKKSITIKERTHTLKKKIKKKCSNIQKIQIIQKKNLRMKRYLKASRRIFLCGLANAAEY
jgi:hypothetical protein